MSWLQSNTDEQTQEGPFGSPGGLTRRAFLSSAVAAGLAAAETAPAGAQVPRARGAWTNVTANVGGKRWGFGGLTYVACVPGRDEVIASVAGNGLWSSSDGGGVWIPLGTKGQIRHRTHQILFDPQNPRTYWVGGSYAAGVFKTTDGGTSFTQLGDVQHVDGIGVDFSDPYRRTLLAGIHEKTRNVYLSVSAGATWRNIGDGLPAGTNYSSEVVVVTDKILLVGVGGVLGQKTSGIYRSEDSGKSWAPAAPFGPAGPALLAANGDIFWSARGGKLYKSADKGASWKDTGTQAPSTLIEMPGGMLAALRRGQVVVSSNGGQSWSQVGPKCPVAGYGLAYCEARRCFYVNQPTQQTISNGIYRLDVS